MNERITENLVRDSLRDLDYYSDEHDTVIEEQKSQIEEVGRLLKSASKTGGTGKGSPEFIISAPSSPDLLIIVECKPSASRHESKDRDKPADFAVDGALHYAKFLSRSFNVVAIAATGQTKASFKISTFLWPKEASSYKDLTNEHRSRIDRILSFEDFARYSSFDPLVAKNRLDDLMAFSRELHDFMRDHAKLTESENRS